MAKINDSQSYVSVPKTNTLEFDSTPYSHWIMRAPETVSFHHIWRTLSVWLAQLSAQTQRTYVSIITDYCAFLGYTAGTDAAANAILTARPVEAIAYFKHLEKRPGQPPRHLRNRRGAIRIVPLSNATIRKNLTCLAIMYDSLIAHGHEMPINPFSQRVIRRPNQRKDQRRPTQMVPFDKVATIIGSVPDSIHATRDRAII